MISECLNEEGLHLSFRKGVGATLRRFGPRVAAGVSDQALSSGANVAINFVLAAWLTEGQYGVFCVGSTMFLIAAGFHNSLILEPVSVLGASRFVQDIHDYLRKVFFGQLAVSLLVAALMAGVAFFTPLDAESKEALLGAAIMSPS